MKINGKTFEGPSKQIVVIPLGDEDVVFTVKCVLDYTDFEALCKTPEPRKLTTPKGDSKLFLDDPDYKVKVAEYALKRTHYMVLKSLEDTEGLEWDTVDFSDPETFGNYSDDLTKAGFADAHIGYLVNQIIAVNGMDEEMLKEAKKRFLATQQASGLPNSQKVEPSNTQSGEPAKD